MISNWNFGINLLLVLTGEEKLSRRAGNVIQLSPSLRTGDRCLLWELNTEACEAHTTKHTPSETRPLKFLLSYHLIPLSLETNYTLSLTERYVCKGAHSSHWEKFGHIRERSAREGWIAIIKIEISYFENNMEPCGNITALFWDIAAYK